MRRERPAGDGDDRDRLPWQFAIDLLPQPDKGIEESQRRLPERGRFHHPSRGDPAGPRYAVEVQHVFELISRMRKQTDKTLPGVPAVMSQRGIETAENRR